MSIIYIVFLKNIINTSEYHFNTIGNKSQNLNIYRFVSLITLTIPKKPNTSESIKFTTIQKTLLFQRFVNKQKHIPFYKGNIGLS